MPVKDIRTVKKTLRERIKTSRALMSEEEKARLDIEILKRVLRQREYIKNDTLFTYVSKDIEVDTKELIRCAWRAGKKVAVPRCIKETRQMDFYYIKSFDDLEKGLFGVLEPIPNKCKLVTDYSKGFCIVPGLSFDSEGFRLGYGMGYYDRFFEKFNGYSAGICYAKSTKWRLPHGKYDREVDVVITERYVRYIHKEHNALEGENRA